MADIRHINFQRRRRWGKQSLTLAKLTGDESLTNVSTVQKDFLVTEPRDESGSDRGLAEGEPLFEFRLYGQKEVGDLALDSFNLLLFAGIKYEVKTKERKLQTRPYIEITARPIGTT